MRDIGRESRGADDNDSETLIDPRPSDEQLLGGLRRVR
jgi:hypothetical protein